MLSEQVCPVVGCANAIDPRWSMHATDHDGKPIVVGCCDGHGFCEATCSENCTCPPVDVNRAGPSPWHEATQHEEPSAARTAASETKEPA